jgi:hypothetical protein
MRKITFFVSFSGYFAEKAKPIKCIISPESPLALGGLFKQGFT